MLKLEHITKIYEKKDASIHAVDDISVEFRTGELCAIIGKSGSGKTTLLNIMGGLMKPDSGTVRIDGKDIYSLKDNELSKLRRNTITTVFQAYNLIPDMTAKENILLSVKLDKRKIDESRFEDIVSELGIKDRLTHKPIELSGGEQQRIAIARALINSPSIILCDEPTGNLDEKSSNNVMQLLRFVNEKYNTTIIVVTHDLMIAENMNRVIKILDGKIVSVEG